jgi:hypothetical protein
MSIARWVRGLFSESEPYLLQRESPAVQGGRESDHF